MLELLPRRYDYYEARRLAAASHAALMPCHYFMRARGTGGAHARCAASALAAACARCCYAEIIAMPCC